jgi:hypothetical protein
MIDNSDLLISLDRRGNFRINAGGDDNVGRDAAVARIYNAYRSIGQLLRPYGFVVQ